MSVSVGFTLLRLEMELHRGATYCASLRIHLALGSTLLVQTDQGLEKDQRYWPRLC